MGTGDSGIELNVPARAIPIPTSVSAQAQAVLATAAHAFSQYPPLTDVDAWKRHIAASNAAVEPMIQRVTATISADVEEIDVDGVRVFVITVGDIAADDRRIYMDVHGGALIMGSGPFCRAMGIANAAMVSAKVYAVDYRLPPDHPYPTPLDDCMSVYRRLLEQHAPDEIIVSGISAGGNLATAMLLRARDESLPLPAAVVLLSPEVDLTESGDSFRTNLGIDTVLTASLMQPNLLYAAGHELTHPYLSPLFGDFSRGFPPAFLATGTRDLFLSNTVRLHRELRRAGVAAELHVFEAMPHGGFGGAPEDMELAREVRRFVHEHWA
jgi:monoterpene epsilon-lactone hydrolase